MVICCEGFCQVGVDFGVGVGDEYCYYECIFCFMLCIV